MSATIDNLKLKAGWVAHKIASNDCVKRELASFTNLLNSASTGQRRRVPPVGDLEKRSNLEARNHVVNYLYAQNVLSKDQPYPDARALSAGLTKLQQEARIPQTGQYDYDTAKYMEQPRCNFVYPQPSYPAGGFAFATYQYKWDKTSLFYCLHNTSVKLPTPQDSYTAASKAFQQWSHASSLRFTEVAPGDPRGVDIEIGFYTGAHGEPNPRDHFSGPGGVLAHSAVPTKPNKKLEIHVDDDEPWSLPDLVTVLLHEIGHALGLDHSLEPSAVMFPSYNFVPMDLTSDDIMAIQSLYGVRTTPWEMTQLSAAVGDKSGIAAVSHDGNDVDVFFTDVSGAVVCMGLEPDGTWQTQQISPPGTSEGRAIATLSRATETIETFWIGDQGCIMGMNWRRLNGQNLYGTYILSPLGSAHRDTQIAAVKRHANVMDVFWITPTGALGSAHWDFGLNQWSTNVLTQDNWAMPGAITAVSRNSENIQVYFIGPDGDVKEFAWSELTNWTYYRVAPPGSARFTNYTGITAVSPHSERVEVFYYREPDVGIDNAWWENGKGWDTYKVSASTDLVSLSGLQSFRRRENYYEVWWVTISAGVKGIVWYDENPFDRTSEGFDRKYRNATVFETGTMGYMSPLARAVRSNFKVDVFGRSPTGNIVQFAFRL